MANTVVFEGILVSLYIFTSSDKRVLILGPVWLPASSRYLNLNLFYELFIFAFKLNNFIRHRKLSLNL